MSQSVALCPLQVPRARRVPLRRGDDARRVVLLNDAVHCFPKHGLEGDLEGMNSCLQNCARVTVSASAVCIAVDPCLWEPQARRKPLPSRPASSRKNPSVLFVA